MIKHLAQTPQETITTNMEKLFNWLSSQINVVFDIAVIVVLAMVASFLLTKIMNNLLKKTLRKDMYPTDADRSKRLNTLNGIGKAVIHFVVWLIAGFMILDALGINTAPLIASAGILGVALGFGTQSLVKDFVSGLFIIVENQYRVGDYIEVQNVSGAVEAITMRTTLLRDIDGSVHVVPNGAIIVSTNRTKGLGHSVIDLTINSDNDIQKVEESINKVGNQMMKDKELAEMITEAPHFLRLCELTDKGMTVQISSTTATGKQEEVKSALLSRLRTEFKSKNITIVSAVAAKPIKK